MLQHECQTRTARVQHEQQRWNTSDTQAAQVQHE